MDMDAVERAYEQHLLPTYHPEEANYPLSRVVLNAKSVSGKLPFDDPSDAGAAYEWFLRFQDIKHDAHELPAPPVPLSSSTEQELELLRGHFAHEELREAAWLAAGQHGFAALAGLPELQALLQHCCMTTADGEAALIKRGLTVPDEVFQRHLRGTPLLAHLNPHLRLCLLADVAAGLLVPEHPLPPDTPEHGAALQRLLAIGASTGLENELEYACSPGPSPSLSKDLAQSLRSQRNLQLAVPGHELLELLCQLMDSDDDSQQQQRGSTEDGSDSGSVDDDDGFGSGGSSSKVLQALRQLTWQWLPSVDLCRQLQQQQPRQSSSSQAEDQPAGHALYSMCLQACERAVGRAMMGLGDNGPALPPAAEQQQQQQQQPASSADLAAQLLASAASMQQKVRAELGEGGSTAGLAAEALAEQLRVLGGGLVLQFVSAARAAGGPAWQQEVPLQAVLLLGALEQLQGLALAAVQQQDVQEAAAAAAATQQQQSCAERAPAGSRCQRRSIAVSIEDSSSEEPEEDKHLLLQQQQQREASQLHTPQQQEQQHLQQLVPADRQLLVVHKLLDIIHLTRQFAQLNAALNSRNSSGNTAGLDAGRSVSRAGSKSSAKQAVPYSELYSVGGLVHALHFEPCTFSAWAQPGTASAAAAAANSAGREHPTPAGIVTGSETKQQPVHALRTQHQEEQQQMHRTLLEGALLLFGAQLDAHSKVFSSDYGLQLLESCSLSDWQSSHDYIRRAYFAGGLFEVAETVAREARRGGIRGIEDAQQLLPALCFGRERLEQLQEQLAQQLQRLRINPSWGTLHDVGVAAVGVSSDDDSDNDGPVTAYMNGRRRSSSGTQGAGSSLGNWFGIRTNRQQQQQQQDADLAGALQAAGERLRQLQDDWSDCQGKPVTAFVEQWLQDAKQQQRIASNWWFDSVQGRGAWTQQQQQQQLGKPLESAQATAAAAAAGGMLSSVSSWIARKTQWATTSSSSSSSQQGAQGSALNGSQADSGGAGSSTSCACPLCQQEQQQQQASAAAGAAAGGVSSGETPSTSAPAGAAAAAAAAKSSVASADRPNEAWRDPFMWRRLVWQLLGRLKPSAQAWYVTHYAMCPHCPEAQLWIAVLRSVSRHLWVPADCNRVKWSLSARHGMMHYDGTWVQQYARALNAAFEDGDGRTDAAALLSHHVLLSLSPLQHKLQPACDVTPLCPSSFVSVVNKLLQQQLGMAQLLQREVKHSDQPLMWHMWWHIGVRRYHWVKQQQQQQDADEEAVEEQYGVQQQGHASSATSRHSKTRDKQRTRKQHAEAAAQQAGLQPLSAGQLSSLYADPAARYYAAGFAARQTAAYGTGIRARAALRAPHLLPCTAVNEMLQYGRLQLLAQQLYEGHQREGFDLQWLDQLMNFHCQGADNSDLFGPPVFPPLFRSEGQAGSMGIASGELEQESQLCNRVGEATRILHLSDCTQLAGAPARRWCQQYKQAMQRCDVCRATLGEEQQQQRPGRGGGWLSCPCCDVPRYCSAQCQMKDEPHHAQLCSLLTAAQQRYGPPSSSSSSRLNSSSFKAPGATATHPARHCWRVLQLLQPEPGPLGMDCQAFAG